MRSRSPCSNVASYVAAIPAAVDVAAQLARVGSCVLRRRDRCRCERRALRRRRLLRASTECEQNQARLQAATSAEHKVHCGDEIAISTERRVIRSLLQPSDQAAAWFEREAAHAATRGRSSSLFRADCSTRQRRRSSMSAGHSASTQVRRTAPAAPARPTQAPPARSTAAVRVRRGERRRRDPAEPRRHSAAAPGQRDARRRLQAVAAQPPARPGDAAALSVYAAEPCSAARDPLPVPADGACRRRSLRSPIRMQDVRAVFQSDAGSAASDAGRGRLEARSQYVPVVDAERERQVLDATVRQASELGIDAASARRLFSLQIRLAVRVQESWISDWRSGAPAPQDAPRSRERAAPAARPPRR